MSASTNNNNNEGQEQQQQQHFVVTLQVPVHLGNPLAMFSPFFGLHSGGMMQEPQGAPPTPKQVLEQLARSKVGDDAAPVGCADSCSVCLSTYESGEEVLVLPCKHAFHASCAQPWLEMHNSCPNCRAAIPVPESASPASATVGDATVGDGEQAAADTPREAAAYVQRLAMQHALQNMIRTQVAAALAAQQQQQEQQRAEAARAQQQQQQQDSAPSRRRTRSDASGDFAAALRRAFTHTASQTTPTNEQQVQQEESLGDAGFAASLRRGLASRQPRQQRQQQQRQQAPEQQQEQPIQEQTHWLHPIIAQATRAFARRFAPQQQQQPEQQQQQQQQQGETRPRSPSSSASEPPAEVKRRRTTRQTRDDLEKCSISTLKALLRSMDVNYSHCIEKRDLVDLLESRMK